MVSVGKDDRRGNFIKQLLWRQALDRGLGADRHKDRRANDAVLCMEQACPRLRHRTLGLNFEVHSPTSLRWSLYRIPYSPVPLPNYARMNLVVGLNGSGKTALLQTLSETAVPHIWIGPDKRPRAAAIRDAVESADHSLVLIDEVENGLHHSLQLELWRDVFHVAESRDVQLFATTHSWDCIRSFTIATHENRHYNAQLIRMDSGTPAIFSRSEMMAAVRERIEIR